MKSRGSKIIIRAVLVVALIYGLAVSLIYLFQKKIIFQSTQLKADHVFQFDQPFSEITIYTGSNNFLNALLFTPQNAEVKGTVIYFHGNADNLQRWGNYAIDFTHHGWNVLMIDYSGYGKSSGQASEEQLYADAEETWQWALHHLPSKRFIIYGRSLGTAVASRLATRHEPEKLILETPFYRLAQENLKAILPFGLKYEFATYRNLPEIDCPIIILQGTNDWIVPLSSASKLKPLLTPQDNFIVIDGGSHRNLRDFKAYQAALEKILE